MRKYLLISLIIICTTIVISSIVFAEIAEQYPSSLQIFFNNLRQYFGFQVFSVVGDSRTCGISGGNPNQEWVIQSGQTFTKSASETTSICGSGGGLYDFFTNGWTPYKEYKDAINTQCGTGPCNIQLYCCPKAECTSSSDCSGGTCNTVTCTIISGTSGYSCPGETRIPYYTDHYSYCTQATTMTCYYRDGNTCGSRNYDKSLFPNSCESYTYQGGKLYSSLSTCQEQLGSCISDSECSAIGKVCQSGTCVTPTCTPNWQTGSWSACTNNVQTRTVTDSNNCGINTNKPATSQSCTPTCTNPSNWVNAYTECCGTKPFGCFDKRCVATEAECGTFGCQETACTSDANCGQPPQCGLNQYMKLSCISGKCQQGCQTGYTKCPNDNRCVSNVNTDCGTPDGGGIGDVKTITWTEFYSISNEDFAKTNYRCKINSDCESREGYNVTCKDEEIMADRTFKSYKEGCDKDLKWMDDTIEILQWICPICTGSFSICGSIAQGRTAWDNYFSGSKYCVAESNTWYGKIWEGVLKLAGGLGLPAQYVMMITIGIIIILLMFILNFIKR